MARSFLSKPVRSLYKWRKGGREYVDVGVDERHKLEEIWVLEVVQRQENLVVGREDLTEGDQHAAVLQVDGLVMRIRRGGIRYAESGGTGRAPWSCSSR